MFFLSGTKQGGKILLQAGDQILHDSVDFRVLQSPLSILHNYAKSKTFLSGINAFPGVNIEQPDVLNEGRALAHEGVENFLQGQRLINHNRQVADGGRLLRDFGILRQSGL